MEIASTVPLRHVFNSFQTFNIYRILQTFDLNIELVVCVYNLNAEEEGRWLNRDTFILYIIFWDSCSKIFETHFRNNFEINFWTFS